MTHQNVKTATSNSMEDGVVAVLAKLGQASLRTLWIHIHFDEQLEMPLDAFVRVVDTKVLSGELSARTDETGVVQYSIAASAKTACTGACILAKIKDLLQVPRKQPEMMKMCDTAPTTVRPYLAILKEIGVVKDGNRGTLFWDNNLEEVLRNLDAYVGFLAESQRLDLDDQLNIEFTGHVMEGASPD